MSESQLELVAEKQRRATQLNALAAIVLPLEAGTPGTWYTLAELCHELHGRFRITASEAGVSARLRELRGKGYQVDRRIRRGALREYRVWSRG